MPLNPGKLDRRITIQSRTTSRDAEGAALVSYADEASVWAELVSLTSAEARRMFALRSEASIVFRIRYRSSLTNQHRIYYGGEYYDIVGDPVEDTAHGRREAMLVAAKHTEAITT